MRTYLLMSYLAVGFSIALGSIPTTQSLCAWDKAHRKASQFVSQLNLTEKVSIVTGGYGDVAALACVGNVGAIERLGFSGLCFSDGPAGVNRHDLVSVFPSGITTAATWDRKLMYKRGVALGHEFRDKGVHVHLGPVSGPLGRHALGGRNWEGFGPDPYLAGVSIAESVTGIQSVGVQACSKHYVGNEQETQRSETTSPDGTSVLAISSNIDDRTLHELYIWPFANAVKAGTASIMCSYNRLNQTYACENPEILRTILRDELGFRGYIVSDWYATHSTAPSANSGLDIEMPGPVSPAYPSYFGDKLANATNGGKVSLDRLDEMARRVLTPYFLLGQDKDFPTIDPASAAAFITYQFGYGSNSPYANIPQVEARDVREQHASLIREIGVAGTVLLKNTNGTIPLLTTAKNIGIFGNDADYPADGSTWVTETTSLGPELGTIDIGGGSGSVRHTSIMTPIEAMQRRASSIGARVQYILDNDLLAAGILNSIYPVPDVCFVFLKAWAREGLDRAALDYQWNATLVVQNVAAVCPNTIVVAHGPGVALMPWADNENVTAILTAHYPGEETGNAIVDAIWGDAEPSGRLPYTIPRVGSEYGPAVVNATADADTDPNAWQADFAEGQFIDYRRFDAEGIEPLYEFGFGLGYTTFDLVGSLEVSVVSGLGSCADPSMGTSIGGLVDLWGTIANATVKVTNTGDRAGSAVPQLYVSFPLDSTPAGTPVKVLRGFDKVLMQPGETAEVQFRLARRDLSYWDVNAKEWVIPKGDFTFKVGFSSRNLKSEVVMKVLG
ncbi:Glycoside hydrolase family 3 protein [Pleurostoma richardsiae]|uniref:Beta-glucosidase cel3A n=1 Tax=Pleurostoma richardsiae TaxID=41990 RepID=A0AA38RGV6_9PEZI|nr:Glycoside hydrolase family 3 protein [Pleurostoma richardsiae]